MDWIGVTIGIVLMFLWAYVLDRRDARVKARNVQIPFMLFTNEGGEYAIKCGACGLTSHNPSDVKYRYCGSCKKFHNHH